MPTGATLNHGALQGNGDWLLSPVDLGGLTLTAGSRTQTAISPC
jgi:hypothetical protein